MADIKISELSTASVLQDADNIELSQSISGSLISSKTNLLALANKIASGTNYTSALDTTDKTLTGAINEKTGVSSIAQVEVSPSENNYSVDDYLMYNGQLYKVISAITSGESLVVGTNIEAANVIDRIDNIRETTLETLEPTTNETWTDFLYRIRADLITGVARFRTLSLTMDGISNMLFHCTRRLSSSSTWESSTTNNNGITFYQIAVSSSTATVRKFAFTTSGLTITQLGSNTAESSITVLGLNNNE